MPLAYLSRIAQTAAPTFAEQNRAQLITALWQELGYEVSQDAIGNVLVKIAPPEVAHQPALVLAAHLDTVFPIATDVTVRERGERLVGAGVGDNSASLAVVTALLRDLAAASNSDHKASDRKPMLDIKSLRRPLWVVANVGEEGLGDLCGAKHLLKEQHQQIGAFIAVDGYLGIVVTHAVGVRRYRADYRGEGGHSWGHQRPSAIRAVAKATEQLYNLSLPETPRTTLNVGTISGGTSVNSIAAEASLVLDLRSLEAEHLDRLDQQAVNIMHQVAEQVGVSLSLERVGDRPGGHLQSQKLLELADEAAKMQHIQLKRATSSTDANAAIPYQLPALAFGVYRGGNAHCEDEWVEPQSFVQGLRYLKQVIGLYQRSPVR